MSKNSQSVQLRLQKFIADCGITSRRKAENYILEGRVLVNGVMVTELGMKVDPSVDIVQVDGATLEPSAIDKVYIVMNKPRAYMTTVSDPEGRPTVMDLIYGVKHRIFPVGRLDYLSEGLLILTNDGEMANMIMHPRYEVEKVYEVKVFGHVNEALLSKMRKGVMSEDGLLKPHSVRVIEQLPHKTWLEFRLNEGKNREIRKICDAVDLTVDKLRRVAVGGLNIQSLPVSQYVFTTKKELLKAIGLNEKGEKVSARKFFSAKRSLDVGKISKIISKTAIPANDRKFHGFKKENYYQTISSIKEAKKLEAEKLLKSDEVKNMNQSSAENDRQQTHNSGSKNFRRPRVQKSRKPYRSKT